MWYPCIRRYNLWSLPRGRSWRDCEDIEDRESAVAHSRIYMRDRIYMGRIHHYLLYDENSWNQKKKVDLLFVFVCWIFL